MFDHVAEALAHLRDVSPASPGERDEGSVARSDDRCPSDSDRAVTRASSGVSNGPNGAESRTERIETLLEQDVVSKADVWHRTGLEDDSFLVELVRHLGGEARQGRLIEQTGWPSSTVSRLLAGLETEGEIRRCQLGREKVVYLPGQAPDTLH